ncbi:MAG: site-specific integrase [Eggerthellaceae bacterium]|nr:site-specific integrase [Eggerthellaceae bacterium]
MTAKHRSGDTWEVSLPRAKSAVRHKDGIRPRRRVHAADAADALRQGEELFAREYASYKMGVTMNLADLAVYFIDHAEADGTYTPETARDYRGLVLRYIEPNFAKDADEVSAIDIERLYAHLLTGGGCKGAGISPNTVHKLNTVLRAAYAFIARENPAISNPMPSVELPARVHSDKRALTDREFVKVLEGLESALAETPEDAAGINRRNMLFGAYLDIHTGARVGEICALTRGSIREIERAARLDHSMSEKGGLHRKEPKTKSGRRTVALDDSTWDMLRKHYEWQATYLTDEQRDSDGTPVCCTASGGFIAPSEMSAAFKGFCASVGVELADGESFHVLRHTHATQLLSNRVNPKEVQRRLGHSKIETTFGYSHVMPGEDAATAADYGAIVERARKAGGFR